LYVDNVSKEHTVSLLRDHFHSENGSSIFLLNVTIHMQAPHGAAMLKTDIDIFTALRASKFKYHAKQVHSSFERLNFHIINKELNEKLNN
jgi:hypothetical protein